MINFNDATRGDFKNISGIGDVKATHIVQTRENFSLRFTRKAFEETMGFDISEGIKEKLLDVMEFDEELSTLSSSRYTSSDQGESSVTCQLGSLSSLVARSIRLQETFTRRYEDERAFRLNQKEIGKMERLNEKKEEIQAQINYRQSKLDERSQYRQEKYMRMLQDDQAKAARKKEESDRLAELAARRHHETMKVLTDLSDQVATSVKAIQELVATKLKRSPGSSDSDDTVINQFKKSRAVCISKFTAQLSGLSLQVHQLEDQMRRTGDGHELDILTVERNGFCTEMVQIEKKMNAYIREMDGKLAEYKKPMRTRLGEPVKGISPINPKSTPHVRKPGIETYDEEAASPVPSAVSRSHHPNDAGDRTVRRVINYSEMSGGSGREDQHHAGGRRHSRRSSRDDQREDSDDKGQHHRDRHRSENNCDRRDEDQRRNGQDGQRNDHNRKDHERQSTPYDRNDQRSNNDQQRYDRGRSYQSRNDDGRSNDSDYHHNRNDDNRRNVNRRQDDRGQENQRRTEDRRGNDNYIHQDRNDYHRNNDRRRDNRRDNHHGSDDSHDDGNYRRNNHRGNDYSRNHRGNDYSRNWRNGGYNQNRNVPPMSKLIFSGKYYKGFMDKFMNIAKQNHWDDQEKLDDLVSRLQDAALDYYSILSKSVKNNFVMLQDKLQKRFDKHHNAAMVRKQLATVSQIVDQDVREYAEHVMRLAVLAHPDSSSTQEKVAIDALLQGCRNASAASVVLNKGPQNFDEAVEWLETAVHNEALIHAKRVRVVEAEVPATDESSVFPGDMSGLKVFLTEKINNIESRLKNSPVRQDLCYNCQKPGHFRRECPLRKSSPRFGSPGSMSYQPRFTSPRAMQYIPQWNPYMAPMTNMSYFGQPNSQNFVQRPPPPGLNYQMPMNPQQMPYQVPMTLQQIPQQMSYQVPMGQQQIPYSNMTPPRNNFPSSGRNMSPGTNNFAQQTRSPQRESQFRPNQGKPSFYRSASPGNTPPGSPRNGGIARAKSPQQVSFKDDNLKE